MTDPSGHRRPQPERPPVTTTKGITATITCLVCAGPVETVTIGRVILGRETSAIVECLSCHRQWHLHVTLGPMDDSDRGVSCGTRGGYDSHRRLGEEACDACKAACAAITAAARQRRAVSA